MPITPDTASQEDIEVASITGSTRLHEHTSRTGSGPPSGSGIQSEHSAFSAYLRDSRMLPSELYIPDGLGDTLALEPILGWLLWTLEQWTQSIHSKNQVIYPLL